MVGQLLTLRSPTAALAAVAYVFAGLFTLLNIAALISTWRTKRFSSGVHIVPTIAAIVGKLAGWSWMGFVAVVALDIGGLALAVKVDPRPVPKKSAPDIKP